MRGHVVVTSSRDVRPQAQAKRVLSQYATSNPVAHVNGHLRLPPRSRVLWLGCVTAGCHARIPGGWHQQPRAARQATAAGVAPSERELHRGGLRGGQ